jgi:hypothetical protein
MEEDDPQQQQEGCHGKDGHNNNPTPMVVLVHKRSKQRHSNEGPRL